MDRPGLFSRGRSVALIAWTLAGVWAAVAWGQTAPRMQFPSASPTPPPVVTMQPSVSHPPPGYVGPPGSAPATVYSQPPVVTYQPPPGGAMPPPGGPLPAPNIPGYQAQPGMIYGDPNYYTPPMDPAFGGGPSALMPQGSPFAGPQFAAPDCGNQTWYRFVQGISLEYTWLHGGNSDRSLDINDIDAAVTFAIPLLGRVDNPIFITPGFGLHLWSGPNDAVADLPSRAFSGYIDATWRPKINEWFAAELAFRPGVYSDFNYVDSNSIRWQGRGVAFIRVTPNVQLALGGAYLDRVRVKFLPVGGVIWTPHERARYEIVFPKPKLSHYMFTSWTNTDWWWYVTGEYGGGSWTVERDAGFRDTIDINDIRVALGVEFRPTQSLDGLPRPLGRNYIGYFEAGYVWDREIYYRVGPPDRFRLRDTFMLRAGLRF